MRIKNWIGYIGKDGFVFRKFVVIGIWFIWVNFERSRFGNILYLMKNYGFCIV